MAAPMPSNSTTLEDELAIAARRAKRNKSLKAGGRRQQAEHHPNINKFLGLAGVRKASGTRVIDCRDCLASTMICAVTGEPGATCECDDRGKRCVFKKCPTCRGNGVHIIDPTGEKIFAAT